MTSLCVEYGFTAATDVVKIGGRPQGDICGLKPLQKICTAMGMKDNLPGRMEVARLSRAVTLVSCPHRKEVNEARLFDREGV
jgi:hypothetical protein